MDFHIYLAAFTLIGLILYGLNKWALKGEIFHPGLIYSLVNGGIFLVFAFGPYNYDVKIDWYYYYIYALITIAFVIGINLGQKTKKNRIVKDIKLSYLQLLILFSILICLNIWQLHNSIIASDSFNFTLEGIANNRLARIALGQQQQGVNLIPYVTTQLVNSFIVIGTSIFLASSFKKKKYIPIIIWFFIAIVIAIAGSSRTSLISFAFTFAVPWFIVKKDSFAGKVKISVKTFKKFLKKNLKKFISLGSIILVLIFVISNVRSNVEVDSYKAHSNSKINYRYELIEPLFRAKKKEWFFSVIDQVSPSIVNPLAELSMYAGGTVATGGVVGRIATENGWHTWGLRNFFVVHRVLSWLKLDGGFSNASRDNYYKVWNMGARELPIVRPGWFSDPGNLILDFGYIFSFIPSLITGFLIGSVYSRFLSQNRPIVSSIVTSVFAFPMLLTPAFNFFGVGVSNAINFFILICYFLAKSRKKIKQSYFIIYPQLQRESKK